MLGFVFDYPYDFFWFHVDIYTANNYVW